MKKYESSNSNNILFAYYSHISLFFIRILFAYFIIFYSHIIRIFYKFICSFHFVAKLRVKYVIFI